MTRTLTDNAGRPLEATIIGRGTTSITVIRKSDGSRFDIPYDRLSAEDQAFAKTLPLAPAPPAPAAVILAPAANKTGGALSFLHAERDDLEKKLNDNLVLIESIDPLTVKARSLRSERLRLMNEMKKVAAEIMEEESR